MGLLIKLAIRLVYHLNRAHSTETLATSLRFTACANEHEDEEFRAVDLDVFDETTKSCPKLRCAVNHESTNK